MPTTTEPPFRASRYTTGAILLHWSIALLVLAQIAGGFAMARVVATGSPLQYQLFQLHKSLGAAVLVLTVARILWRLFNPAPPEPASVSRIERIAAGIAHKVFYLLLVVIPLAGWVLITVSPIQIETVLFFQTWLPWPHLPGLGGLDEAARMQVNAVAEQLHMVLAYAMGLLVVLHVAGAIKHQREDGLYLRRMWFVSRGDGPRNAYGHATTVLTTIVFAGAIIGAAAIARSRDEPVVARSPAAVSPDQADVLASGAAIAPDTLPPVAEVAPTAETDETTASAPVEDATDTPTTANAAAEPTAETDEAAAGAPAEVASAAPTTPTAEAEPPAETDETAADTPSEVATTAPADANVDAEPMAETEETASDGPSEVATATANAAESTAETDDTAADMPSDVATTAPTDANGAAAPTGETDETAAEAPTEVAATAPTTPIAEAESTDEIGETAADTPSEVATTAPTDANGAAAPTGETDETAADTPTEVATTAPADANVAVAPIAETEETASDGPSEVATATANAAEPTVETDEAAADMPSDVATTAPTAAEPTAETDETISDTPAEVASAAPAALTAEAEPTVETDETAANAPSEVGTTAPTAANAAAAPTAETDEMASDAPAEVASAAPAAPAAEAEPTVETDETAGDTPSKAATTAPTGPRAEVEPTAGTDEMAAGAPVEVAVAQDGPALRSPAQVPEWSLVPGESALSFDIGFQANRVDGSFGAFAATIKFDPNNLEGSQILVEVDLDSVTLEGGSISNAQLKGPDGLGVAGNPVARFASETIRRTGDGTYAADGTLSLRSATAPVSLNFTLSIEGERALAKGRAELMRLDFGVGRQSDPKGGTLSQDVAVEFTVTAVRD